MEPLKIGITGVRGVVGETLDPGARRALRGGVRHVPRRRPRARVPRPPALGADAAGGGHRGPPLGGLRGRRPRRLPDAEPAARGEVARRDAAASRSPAATTRRSGTRSSSCATTGSTSARSRARSCSTSTTRARCPRARWDRHRRRASTGTTRSRPTSRRCAPRFDVAAVRARRLRVAVDCCNGSCSRLVPALARGARLRGAADQRRPVAAVPALARARGRAAAAQVRALVQRGPGRPRPRPRRRRRAAEPGGRDGDSRSPRS